MTRCKTVMIAIATAALALASFQSGADAKGARSAALGGSSFAGRSLGSFTSKPSFSGIKSPGATFKPISGLRPVSNLRPVSGLKPLPGLKPVPGFKPKPIKLPPGFKPLPPIVKPPIKLPPGVKPPIKPLPPIVKPPKPLPPIVQPPKPKPPKGHGHHWVWGGITILATEYAGCGYEYYMWKSTGTTHWYRRYAECRGYE